MSRLVVCIFLLTAASQSYCKEAEEASVEKNNVAKEGLDPSKIEGVAFENEIIGLFKEKKYDEIDKIAEPLRSNLTRYEQNGSLKIFNVYETFELLRSEPIEVWEKREKDLTNWATEKPDSVVPKLLLASFYIKYAWKARGSGYAHEVEENGWELFHSRLKKSKEILDDYKTLNIKCPFAYDVEMVLALGQCWSRDDFKKVYAEARTIYPSINHYQFRKAVYLLPRWHGEEGEWEAELEKENDLTTDEGLEAYSYVVDKMAGLHKNIFKEAKISWDITRKGFEVKCKRLPNCMSVLNHYCKIAYIAGDEALCKKLFDEIGDRTVYASWGPTEKEGKEYAAKVKAWVNRKHQQEKK